MDIPKLLAGRLPSPSAPQEVAVNQIGAQQLNLHVGSVLTMVAEGNSPHPRPVKLTEHVVGIFVTRGSVLPVTYLDRDATVLASLALYRELGPNYEAFDGAYVTLKPGTSLATFSAAAENLAKRYPSTGGQVFTADERNAGGDHRAADPPAGDRPGAVRARPGAHRAAHRRPGRGAGRC